MAGSRVLATLVGLVALGCAGLTSVARAEEPVEPFCTVDARLVNSCRPWFGSSAGYYPLSNIWDKKAQLLYAEERTGRQLEIVHTYHVAGDNQLSEADRYFAARPDTLLMTNYQLTKDWSTADGSDAGVNAQIDQMAASIASLEDTRILLVLHHEPENDVTAAPGCAQTLRGTYGTPEEYRAMWRNVRSRFDAAGVTNVVWGMDYINYPPFNCMIEDLYPGDDLVDWIFFNAYQRGNSGVGFTARVRNLYDFLTARSRPGFDFLSKPWGIGEWGINASTQANAALFYQQARAAVEQNLLPQLHAFVAFDSTDPNTGDGSYRVAFGLSGEFDQAEQDAYNSFAHSFGFSGAGTSDPARLPAPQGLTAVFTADGHARLTWEPAGPESPVASYDVLRDGVVVGSGPDASYLDTEPAAGSTHAYAVRATDASGLPGAVSQPVSLTMADLTPPTVPADVTATLVAGVPHLTWSASADEFGVAGYEVLRNGAVVGTTTDLSLDDPAARQGATHTYTVRARDTSGNVSAASAPASVLVPDVVPPSAPPSLTVQRARTSATLTWGRATDNVGVTGYLVYRGTTLVARVGPSTLRYTVWNLVRGTRYTFSVVARDAAGNLGPAASVGG